MVIVKISKEDIVEGQTFSCTKCPLARAMKRAYDATAVRINYTNFNKGTTEKPDWIYRGYAELRWENAHQHKIWDFGEVKGKDAVIMLALPKMMTKWVADYDRIGSARSVTFRMKWQPQQR